MKRVLFFILFLNASIVADPVKTDPLVVERVNKIKNEKQLTNISNYIETFAIGVFGQSKNIFQEKIQEEELNRWLQINRELLAYAVFGKPEYNLIKNELLNIQNFIFGDEAPNSLQFFQLLYKFLHSSTLVKTRVLQIESPMYPQFKKRLQTFSSKDIPTMKHVLDNIIRKLGTQLNDETFKTILAKESTSSIFPTLSVFVKEYLANIGNKTKLEGLMTKTFPKKGLKFAVIEAYDKLVRVQYIEREKTPGWFQKNYFTDVSKILEDMLKQFPEFINLAPSTQVYMASKDKNALILLSLALAMRSIVEKIDRSLNEQKAAVQAILTS